MRAAFLFLFFCFHAQAISWNPAIVKKKNLLKEIESIDHLILNQKNQIQQYQGQELKFKANLSKDMRQLAYSVILFQKVKQSFLMKVGGFEIPKKKFFRDVVLYHLHQLSFLSQQQALRAKELSDIQARKEGLLKTLHRLSSSFAASELNRISKNDKEFDQLLSHIQGQLPFPMSAGKVVSHFGSYRDVQTNLKIFKKGIEIKPTLKGKLQNVRAVLSGRIAYEGARQQMGKVIIIDHGNHFYSLSAHLSKTSKKLNDRVQQGEVIGLIDTSQVLYFELRVKNEAVNPLNWLSRSI